MKFRYENFGGIIAAQSPPFLAFVDRDYMRNLGLADSVLWDNADESIGLLSGPTEVHFAITNKCSAQCPHCYMGAGHEDDNELDTDSLKLALDVLAGMGVFHVALGGGEALERSDLFEIAEYARTIELVPNLTISGRHVTEQIARKMKVFGQVNVSLDAIGSANSVFRGQDMFENADNALWMLIEAGVPTGINCVIGRKNFEQIEPLFEYARGKKLNEIEFLRFKPSGRGADLYRQHRTTYEQNIALTPLLAKLSGQYGITAKIDCSFVPMLCYHKPPRDVLEAIATYGCEAGNILLGVRSNGLVAGCSFMKTSGLSVFDLPSAFAGKEHFEPVRAWSERAVEPCRSCEYLDICKGGCHAVAEHVTGSFDAPDPDCPFVVEYHQKERGND